MPRILFATALLTLSLAAPAIHSQPATTNSTNPTNSTNSSGAETEINPAAIQALKDMGARLQTLKRFHISTDLTGEVVLADGQKLQHTATAEMDVQRPAKLRARMFSARAERIVIFDGQRATMYLPQQKYFSTVDFSGDVGDLVNKLEERYGVELPLTDLFLWGTPAAPLDSINSAMNAGQDFIGSDLCNHFAFRQGNFDWQIWISADGNLPRKLVTTNRGDDARPQSVSLIDWNLNPQFKDDIFSFVAPKGARPVELHALEGK